MNFVFVSPHFPHTYWQFCDRLKRNGLNVLGIGDAPYDGLEAPLKAALTETNTTWLAAALCEQIKLEHEQMKKTQG